MIAVASVVIPTLAWLIKEVLTLRKDMIRLQAHVENMHEVCRERGKLFTSQNSMLTRLDRNIVRLCQKQGVEYEGE